jgi:hypothetical protein
MALAAMKEKVDFPSGSNWGIPQLKKLNFPLQPESHPFEDLQWEHDLSKESLDILNQLILGSGLHEDEWAKYSDNSKYKDFYDRLIAMLPQVKGETAHQVNLLSDPIQSYLRPPISLQVLVLLKAYKGQLHTRRK